MSEAREKALLAKKAAPVVGKAPAAQRSEAIRMAAQAILDHEADILAANAADYERSEARGMSAPCHTVTIFQDGVQIGEAVYGGGTLPEELR